MSAKHTPVPDLLEWSEPVPNVDGHEVVRVTYAGAFVGEARTDQVSRDVYAVSYADERPRGLGVFATVGSASVALARAAIAKAHGEPSA